MKAFCFVAEGFGSAFWLDIQRVAGSFRSGVNTRNQTQHSVQCQNRTAAVADEGQGQAETGATPMHMPTLIMIWNISAEAAPKQTILRR